MNGISPVLPVTEPVVDEGIEGWVLGEPGTTVLEEEPIPEGVALLLAVIEQMPGRAHRPGVTSMVTADRQMSPGGMAQEVAGARNETDVPAQPKVAVSVAGRLSTVEKGSARVAERLPAVEKDAVPATGRLSVESKVPVLIRDGLSDPVQGVTVEENPITLGEENRVSTGTLQQEPAQRATDEFSHGLPLVRQESSVHSAQAFFPATADEQATASEQHGDASPQTPEEEDQASGEFLQVPFHNERASGQVLVSRDETGESGLLIRATDRQVFEQLKEHFDQTRQSRWRLGDDEAGLA